MVTDLSCLHTVHYLPSFGARNTFPKCTLALYTSFHVPADLGLSSIPGLNFLSLALDLRSALFLHQAVDPSISYRSIHPATSTCRITRTFTRFTGQIASPPPPTIPPPLRNSVQIAVATALSRNGEACVDDFSVVKRISIFLLRAAEAHTKKGFSVIASTAQGTPRRRVALFSRWRRGRV